MEEKQVHENELVIPALKIIASYPRITTSELIKKLENEVKLYPKDREILSGRKDTYFSQTVRNLCGSHLKTNKFGKCIEVDETNKVNSFTINENGIKILNDNDIEILEEISEDECFQKEIENSNVYNEEELVKATKRIPQIVVGSKTKMYKKDARIAKTVLKNQNYECEYAKLNGEKHNTFITKKGVEYQEGHHLVPMKAQKDFIINIDIPENIVCLCPICHRAIHNGCKDAKIKYLRKLYDLKIKNLNKAGINISFEDLYNKYYV